jgi:hypothetical protein
VRIAVALTVPIAGPPLRNQLFKRKQHIMHNAWVSVLINGYASSCVRTVNSHLTCANAAGANQLGHPSRYVNHLATSLAADFENFINNLHVFSLHFAAGQIEVFQFLPLALYLFVSVAIIPVAEPINRK